MSSPEQIVISSCSISIFAKLTCTVSLREQPIGQLDSESLFYLRSRGVSLEEAKGLLTFAFASEAIQNIIIAELRSLVQKTMSNKLNVDIEL